MKSNALGKTWGVLIVAVAILIIAPVKTEAHIPTIAGANHGTIKNSLHLDDIIISKAIYQSLTRQNPHSYISFSAEKGQTLYLEIGIPKIGRLEDFRPDITLFHLHADRGTTLSMKRLTEILLISTDQSSPIPFHEPFTDTHSWILEKKVISLPLTGNYYLRSAHPDDKAGKMWVAIGRQERFAASDWGNLPASILDVRGFHESNNTIAKRHTVSFLTVGLIAVVCVLTPFYLLRYRVQSLSKMLWKHFCR